MFLVGKVDNDEFGAGIGVAGTPIAKKGVQVFVYGVVEMSTWERGA